MKKTKNRIRDRVVLYTIAIVFLGLIALGYTIQLNKAIAYEIPAVSVPQKSSLSIKEQICEATNGENCDVIYNLCKAESGCSQYAINKNRNATYDYSYFQVNQIHIKGMSKKGTLEMSCVYNLSCISKWVNNQVKIGNLHIWVAASKI